MILVFISFVGILALTLWHEEQARTLKNRSREEWILDLSGLLVQGIGVPLLQTFGLYNLFLVLIPSWQGCLHVPHVVSFLLSFVVVDYLYYWNHRLLHSCALWPFHSVHHTPAFVDLLTTSRNCIWTPFLLVYLWVNGLLIFMLAEPSSFLLGVSLTAALDIWRHSGFGRVPPPLSQLLITPTAHALHHSPAGTQKNFGSNLSLWDRLHGTYLGSAPSGCGIPLPLSLRRKLFYPFPRENRG